MMASENVTNSEQVEEDLSLLQQPLKTAFVGFQEAKRAFEDGTDEVRHLLMHECSLIYECKICRNLFRSLANFISHKRVFCSRSIQASGFQKTFPDDNSAVILQASDMIRTKGTFSSRSSPVPETKPINKATTNTKDLCEVIERLRREKGSKADHSRETVLQLEKVPTSTNAVYQTVKHLKEDSIRVEVNEVYDLLNNKHTEVGPDGKAVTKHKYDFNRNSSNEDKSNDFAEQNQDSLGQMFCEICNLGFQTDKTLQMHMQKKHIATTYVYLCPECSTTFLKPSLVLQHLVIDHLKSRRRVRLMRDGIIKRRMQQCDAPVKTQNRELKRLQLDQDVNKEKTENADNANAEVLPKCAFCGETFKRNAALTAHMLNCPQKLKDEQTRHMTKSNSLLNSKVKYSQSPLPKVVIKAEKDAAIDLSEMFANLEMPKYDMSLKTVSLERLEMSDISNSESTNTSATDAGSRFNISTKSESFGADNENSSHFKNNFLPNRRQSLKPEQASRGVVNSSPLAKQEIKTEIIQPSNEENKVPPTLPLEDKNESLKVPVKIERTQSPSPLKVKKKRVTEKTTSCLCKLCNKKYNTISNLKRHITMFHYRTRQFSCKFCATNFLRKYDVANHLISVHKRSEPRDFLIKEFVKAHDVTHSKKDIESTILVMPEADTSTDNQQNKVSPLKIMKAFRKRKKIAKAKSPLPLPSKALALRASSTPYRLSPFQSVKSLSPSPDKASKFPLTPKQEKQDQSTKTPSRKESLNSPKESPNSEKRPTRKRSKPVNKDFVYDMATYAKKESIPERESSRLMRKRSLAANSPQEAKTMFKGSSNQEKSEEQKQNDEELSVAAKSYFVGNLNHKLEGAVKRIALRKWREGLCTLGFVPDFSNENPDDALNNVPTHPQNIKQAGPVIDSEDLAKARRNCTLLDDVFLQNFTKHPPGAPANFKIKPCLESERSSLSTFLEALQKKTLSKQNELQKSTEDSSNQPKEIKTEISETTLEDESKIKQENVCEEGEISNGFLALSNGNAFESPSGGPLLKQENLEKEDSSASSKLQSGHTVPHNSFAENKQSFYETETDLPNSTNSFNSTANLNDSMNLTHPADSTNLINSFNTISSPLSTSSPLLTNSLYSNNSLYSTNSFYSTNSSLSTNAPLSANSSHLPNSPLSSNSPLLQNLNDNNCDLNNPTTRNTKPMPPRRLTLLQHLAENKLKKKNCLLKAALEN